MKNQLNKKFDVTKEYEEAVGNGFHKGKYVLRLFTTGMTHRSAEAIASIKAFCEKHLHGRYDLEMTFTPDRSLHGPDGTPPAATVDSGPSLFTALQEQLGLKLEPDVETVEVLVIDHVERPTPD